MAAEQNPVPEADFDWAEGLEESAPSQEVSEKTPAAPQPPAREAKEGETLPTPPFEGKLLLTLDEDGDSFSVRRISVEEGER